MKAELYTVTLYKLTQFNSIDCKENSLNNDEICYNIKHKYFPNKKTANKYYKELLTKLVNSITIEEVINNKEMLIDNFCYDYYLFEKFQDLKLINIFPADYIFNYGSIRKYISLLSDQEWLNLIQYNAKLISRDNQRREFFRKHIIRIIKLIAITNQKSTVYI